MLSRNSQNVQTQADKKYSYFDRAGAAREMLALLITGLAVILFSTAGIARMMGWGPNLTGDSGDHLTLDQTDLVPPTGGTRAGGRCPECGVIVSMREIETHEEDSGPGVAGAVTAGNRGETRAKSTRRYEITVRMADGLNRVIDQENPASWRTGERLIVIAGTDPSLP